MKLYLVATVMAALLVSATALAGDGRTGRSSVPPRPILMAAYVRQNDVLRSEAVMRDPETDRDANTAFLALLVLVRAEASSERQKR